MATLLLQLLEEIFKIVKEWNFGNSVDGSVQLITDVIPPEIGRSSGNNDSKL